MSRHGPEFTNSELAAAMRAGVATIREKGWIKGNYIDSAGKVCAVGALRVGVGCDVNDVGGYDSYATESDEVRRRWLVERTVGAVEHCLVEEQRAAGRPENMLFTGLISFNDEAAREADDVTGLMERCAERLEAEDGA